MIAIENSDFISSNCAFVSERNRENTRNIWEHFVIFIITMYILPLSIWNSVDWYDQVFWEISMCALPINFRDIDIRTFMLHCACDKGGKICCCQVYNCSRVQQMKLGKLWEWPEIQIKSHVLSHTRTQNIWLTAATSHSWRRLVYDNLLILHFTQSINAMKITVIFYSNHFWYVRLSFILSLLRDFLFATSFYLLRIYSVRSFVLEWSKNFKRKDRQRTKEKMWILPEKRSFFP